MNNRTIAGGVLAAVLVLAVWWMFVFSPVRSDASKVDTEIESAQADTKSLEAENAQLDDLERVPGAISEKIHLDGEADGIGRIVRKRDGLSAEVRHQIGIARFAGFHSRVLPRPSLSSGCAQLVEIVDGAKP